MKRVHDIRIHVHVSWSVTVILCLVNVQSRLQEITFYANLDYTGDNETFVSSVDNFERSTRLGSEAKSYCIKFGAWKVYGYHSSLGPVKSPNVTFNSFSDGVVCVSHISQGMSTHFRSIRHIGTQDLDCSGLTLYADEDFEGMSLDVTTSQQTLLRPQVFHSWAITGSFPWTVFSGPRFSGTSACLKTSGKTLTDRMNSTILHAVTVRANDSITIYSAYRGCGSSPQEIPERITPQPVTLTTFVPPFRQPTSTTRSPSTTRTTQSLTPTHAQVTQGPKPKESTATFLKMDTQYTALTLFIVTLLNIKGRHS